jgi:hypothetical protein
LCSSKESFKYIHNSIVKTYACERATPGSKNKMNKMEEDPIINRNNLIFVTSDTNNEIICTRVWPAIILALNLIAKLKDLIMYENISVHISIGSNDKGHSGINIFINFML